MPEMDGLECTAAIRERELVTGCHLPIIAMTAQAMSGDAARCLAAGMDAYLSKPIRPDELFELIDHHLGASDLPVPRATSSQRGLRVGERSSRSTGRLSDALSEIPANVRGSAATNVNPAPISRHSS